MAQITWFVLDIRLVLVLQIGVIAMAGDMLKKNLTHRTQKAQQNTNDLSCYKCQTLDVNNSLCMNVSVDEESIKHKCEEDKRTCMVKRISFTTSTGNSTSVQKVWSLERNCTNKCEPGCIIIGERTKVYTCSTCCNSSFCNHDNSSSTSINLNKVGEGNEGGKKQTESRLELMDKNIAYQIRPALSEKFKSLTVKEIIHQVLSDELHGKIYSSDDSEEWTKNIVSNVKQAVKGLGFKRYKLVVQTILGEEKGSGLKIGARCLWDADTDNFATHHFTNDTMFCVVSVFGIYSY